MPLDETIETFSHFIKEADALGLAYLCLVRYAEKLEVKFDGMPFYPCFSSAFAKPKYQLAQTSPAPPCTTS